MIRFTCSCGKAYQLQEKLAGKKVKCPACQAVMTVPAAPPVEALQPLEPLFAAELAPLRGPTPLSPLSANNLFADFPPAAPVMQQPLGMPQGQPMGMSLGQPLGMPHGQPLGMPQGQPMGQLRAPTAFGPTAAQPPGSGSPVMIWVIAGVSTLCVLLVIGVSIAIVSLVNRMPQAANVPLGPADPYQAPPGAPSGQGMPNVDPRVNQPTVNRDWRGRGTIGSDVGNWQKYTSLDGGYEINLPGKPQVVPQDLDTPSGRVSGASAIVGSDATGLVVGVTHVDVPFDPSQVPLDKLAELQITMQGGTIVRTSDITVSQRPGKEFLTELNKNGFVGRGIFRTFAAGKRTFTLVYLGFNGRFDEVKAQECLNSFVLTKEPPPVASAAAGGQPFNAGIPIARDVAWTKIDSAQNQFRVELPAAGKRMESTPQEQGLKETWACEIAGKGAFFVNATPNLIPIPESGVPVAIDLVRQALSKTAGKLTHETSSRQGTTNVSDFVFDNETTGLRTLVRVYFTSKTTYQLTWGGPANQANSAEVGQFFNSFAITDPGQTPATSQPPTTPKGPAQTEF